MIKKFIRSCVVKLGILLQQVEGIIAEKTMPKFANSPKNIRIDLPRKIVNSDRIFLGNNIWFGPNSFLMAIKQYPGPSMKHPDREVAIQNFNPKIVIGNRVTSTGGVQIVAANEVILEDDVLLASNIHINDCSHGYSNANEPYKYQKVSANLSIVIGKGSWIGQNVVVLPGVKIGKYSIIGANSVVSKSVPARSIAVGAPAKVIKKWEEATQKWVGC